MAWMVEQVGRTGGGRTLEWKVNTWKGPKGGEGKDGRTDGRTGLWMGARRSRGESERWLESGLAASESFRPSALLLLSAQQPAASPLSLSLSLSMCLEEGQDTGGEGRGERAATVHARVSVFARIGRPRPSASCSSVRPLFPLLNWQQMNRRVS